MTRGLPPAGTSRVLSSAPNRFNENRATGKIICVKKIEAIKTKLVTYAYISCS